MSVRARERVCVEGGRGVEVKHGASNTCWRAREDCMVLEVVPKAEKVIIASMVT